MRTAATPSDLVRQPRQKSRYCLFNGMACVPVRSYLARLHTRYSLVPRCHPTALCAPARACGRSTAPRTSSPLPSLASSRWSSQRFNLLISHKKTAVVFADLGLKRKTDLSTLESYFYKMETSCFLRVVLFLTKRMNKLLF